MLQHGRHRGLYETQQYTVALQVRRPAGQDVKVPVGQNRTLRNVSYACTPATPDVSFLGSS